MRMTEDQRKAEINRIRRVRAKANAEIETQILELSKKRMSEELRKAELNALVKSRAKNNADTKAQLIRLGVKYATRIPPARPLACTCDQITCDCKEFIGIDEFKDQADEMLEHIERVASYRVKPSKVPADIALDDGKLDSTEIEKVRCEVAEVQGSLNMLTRFLSSQNVNVIDSQPYIQKLAHIETVCCQQNGRIDKGEIEKVKSEILEVKDAVNSLTKSFDSYNMGKMHGVLESLRNPGNQPQPQPQPQVQPVIVQTPPQQILHQQMQPQQAPAQQTPPPPVVDQKESSGLAELLASMSMKLDALEQDII